MLVTSDMKNVVSFLRAFPHGVRFNGIPPRFFVIPVSATSSAKLNAGGSRPGIYRQGEMGRWFNELLLTIARRRGLPRRREGVRSDD